MIRHKREHPSNVILLDNAALQKFYGPTLYGLSGLQLQFRSAVELRSHMEPVDCVSAASANATVTSASLSAAAGI
jgi:hypothetical protein